MNENNNGESALLKQFREIFGDHTEADARAMLMSFQKLMSYYRCAIMEVETKFKVLNEEFSLLHDRNPINAIHTRLKSGNSIKEKLQRRNLPNNIEAIEENLEDIAGIRIVCPFCEDVYYLEKAFLEQDDITLIRKKDYISKPKENGYRSLHLIVAVPIFLSNQKKLMKVEVQLRTIAMDSWAALEHQLRYKKEIDQTQLVERELSKCAELSYELDTRMNRLRNILLTEVSDIG